MKKKFKLITTFASLGLALALMAFGVYAATTATFNVSGTFNFTATANVDADVQVFESANNLAAALAADAATGWTAVEYATGKTTYEIRYSQTPVTDGDTDGGGTFALTNTTLEEEAGVSQFYCVKVVITNKTTNAANKLTVTYNAPTGTNVTATDTSVDGLVATGTNDTVTIVFTYRVTDVAQSAALTFDTAFTITAS